MDWVSLLLPFGYLTVLILSLGTFSHLYRRRKAAAAASLAPWFPAHQSRQIYLSLLELASNPQHGQKIPDSVLRAALLRRATDNIHRLISLRNAKPALQQLLQRGSVGDELWQRFQVAEKEMEAELKDCVNEANALAPQQNWGQTIFQSAGECAHQEVLRSRLKDIEATRAQEKEDWERRRASMREGFMKELEGSGKEEATDTKEARKPGSSDEDGVIVEGGGPDSPMPPSSSARAKEVTASGGGGKKKKNKK